MRITSREAEAAELYDIAPSSHPTTPRPLLSPKRRNHPRLPGPLNSKQNIQNARRIPKHLAHLHQRLTTRIQMRGQIDVELRRDVGDDAVDEHERGGEGGVDDLHVGAAQRVELLVAGDEAGEVDGGADAHFARVVGAGAHEGLGLDVVFGAEGAVEDDD